MPGVIDIETLNVDEQPGVWAPVQWEQTEADRVAEIEKQANASLLSVVDVPEAVLRLFLNETDGEITYGPPPGYDPEEQGEWDPEVLTFTFRRSLRLVRVKRSPELLEIEYDFGDLGHWQFEIEPESVTFARV